MQLLGPFKCCYRVDCKWEVVLFSQCVPEEVVPGCTAALPLDQKVHHHLICCSDAKAIQTSSGCAHATNYIIHPLWRSSTPSKQGVC